MKEIVYDVGGYEAPMRFEIVPPGNYRCEIVAYSDEPSKAGKPMLTVTWNILDGECENVALREYFVMDENNERSHKINMGRLKRMVTAVGVATRFKGSQLVGKRCELRVTSKLDESTNPPRERNDIVDHKPISMRRKPVAARQDADETDEPAKRTAPPRRPAPAKEELVRNITTREDLEEAFGGKGPSSPELTVASEEDYPF